MRRRGLRRLRRRGNRRWPRPRVRRGRPRRPLLHFLILRGDDSGAQWPTVPLPNTVPSSFWCCCDCFRASPARVRVIRFSIGPIASFRGAAGRGRRRSSFCHHVRGAVPGNTKHILDVVGGAHNAHHRVAIRRGRRPLVKPPPRGRALALARAERPELVPRSPLMGADRTCRISVGSGQVI